MKMVTVVTPYTTEHQEYLLDVKECVRQQTIETAFVAVHDKHRKGPGWARNKGVKQVRTPFVIFCDADDTLAPTFAERCLNAWRPGHYVWTHWYENGIVHPLPDRDKQAYDHTVSCFMSTDLALAYPFDEDIEAEDTDFYVRLLTKGIKKIRVAEPLMTYNTTRSTRSTELAEKPNGTENALKVIAQRYTFDTPWGNLPVANGLPELAQQVNGNHWRPPPVSKPANVKKRPRRKYSDISIVVPTCDRLAWLQNMIASARQSIAERRYEFIIVDGGSKDGTLTWCKAEPDVWLIEHGALLGTVKAFSDGGFDARGKYVLMCNDDTEFVSQAIDIAADWLDGNPRCGCVAFAYDTPQTPGKFIVGKHVFDRPNGQTVEYPFANMGLYRKALGDVFGWAGINDPDFNARSYGSDSYMSVKVWEAGYTLDQVEGAIVHDRDARDKLKRVNQWPPDMRNPDTQAFYVRYPHGPQVPCSPLKLS